MSRISVIDRGAIPADRRTPSRAACFAMLWFALFASLVTGAARASVEVGSIVFAKGAVSARDATGGVRLLGRDSEVFQEDTIATADDSFAVIRFVDETKMSIRPNSEVVIDRFSATEGEETAEFNLLKGGLRAITGAIGSRKPESVRFRTRAASIGIRGTDLVIRDCQDDGCAQEELELSQFEPLDTECVVPVTGYPPAVYYAVLDGGIYAEKDDRKVELDAPAAGYADDQEMSCMSAIPRFILHDDALNRIELDWAEIQVFDILGVGGDDNPICEIL